MLSIGSLSLDQTVYYERTVARGAEDYYAGRGESPGQWAGSGSDQLGLAGTVSGDAFAALMAGRDPSSGDSLVRRRGERPVAALDLTFSAPKSVSVLYAVGEAELSGALVEAHELAVRAALGFLEAEACEVRRGHAGEQRLQAQGFVAAAYRHRMSRAQDPQLHTHVVTANMARGADGRWTALDGRALFRHAKAAGCVYQAQLRHSVCEALAFAQWGAVRHGMAELEGIEPSVLREFSQRRVQIEQREAELVAAGVAVGAAGRETIAHDTRERKEHAIDTPSWRAAIAARAQEHGLGAVELAALLQRRRPRAASVGELWGAEAERLVGPAGLTERQNSFQARDVTIALAGAAGQGASATELRKAVARFLEREDVLELAGGHGGERRYTTADLLRCEQAIVAAAEHRKGSGVGVVQRDLVDRVLARRVVALTGEQEAVLRAVCKFGHGIEVLEALAGTGKTTVAGAIAEVYRAAGWRVLGVAPTGRATRELKEQAGIGHCLTLARLLLDFQQHGGGLGGAPALVILDEASMASTREVARLLAEASVSGAKVLAIGDSGQLPSVQAGGWLGALARRQGAARMVEVMRQRDPRERLLLERLHGGLPEAYLEHKTLGGLLRVMDAGDAERAALAAWRERAREAGIEQAVLITRNNALRARLNAAVRELRADELGERARYAELQLAVGDRVICRRNDRRCDVDNGTRGTILAVAQDGIVLRTDAGAERSLPAAYCAQDLEHAYALTAHGMQGATVQWAGVLAAPGEMTRNWSYTALSRAREPTEIFVLQGPSEAEQERAEIAPGASRRRDPLGELARAMRRRDDEDLATDQSAAGEPAVTGLSPTAEEAAPAGRAAVPASSADTRQLQGELAELRRQIAAGGRQPDAPRVGADLAQGELEPVLARQRELRAELAARRKHHIERALADPPEDLLRALGPPPEDAIARQRWEVRARQAEALRFESGRPPPAAPVPTPGPTQRGDRSPPRRDGPSLGR